MGTDRGNRSASAPALKDPIYPQSACNVVGRAREKRRAKRSGYQHKAAVPSDSKLLYMPSESRAAKSRADAYLQVAAGVESDKYAKSVSTFMNARVDVNKNKPIYFPSPYTDPITHKEFDECFFQRDKTKVQGAAGKKAQQLVTDRAEDKKRQQLIDGATKKSVPRLKHPNPIELMNLEAEMTHSGRKRFPDYQNVCQVALDHQEGGLQPKLTAEQEGKLAKKMNRQVLLGSGKWSYAMHGEMDRLPGGKAKYNKADWPPSFLLRFDNDKKSGIQPSQRAMSQRSMTLFSSDELYAMFGMRRPPSPDLHHRRSLDISRELHMKAEKARAEKILQDLWEGRKNNELDQGRKTTDLSIAGMIAHQIAKEEGLSTESSVSANDIDELDRQTNTDRPTSVRLRSGPGSVISERTQSARGSLRSPRLSSSVPQSARSPSASSTGRPPMPRSARGLTRTSSESGLGLAGQGGSPAAGSLLSARSSSLTSSAAALQAALAQSAALSAAASPGRRAQRRDSETGRIMWRSSSSPALN